MKTKIIAIIVGITLAQHSSVAFGDALCYPISCDGVTTSDIVDYAVGCGNKIYECYRTQDTKHTRMVGRCNTCQNGTQPMERSFHGLTPCEGTYYYATCGEGECKSCEGVQCEEPTDWTAVAGPRGAAYEQQTVSYCNCGQCQTMTIYRCAAGYYGSSTNGRTGCTICPDGGMSNPEARNASVTDCYLATFSDDTGSGTYTGNCYYSN